jgi:hypothetical protein
MHSGSRPLGGRAVLLALTVFCVAGCGGGASRQESKAEAEARLEGFAPGDPVVLACRMKSVPETFPVGDGGRELSRGDSGILIQVPRSDYERVAKVPGVQAVTVWGTPAQVETMDPWLQTQVLNAWSREEPLAISCMVRFTNGAQDLRQRLTDLGATPRTVAGPVVSLDANAKTLIAILAMPDLVRIEQPRMLTPIDQKAGN